MVIPAAGDHCTDIGNDLVGTKKCTIHPSTTLLHKYSKTKRAVSEGFGVRNVLHCVPRVLLDVDLETHDSVLCKIFIRFGAARSLLPRNILEEFVQGCALDSLPAEDTIGSR